MVGMEHRTRPVHPALRPYLHDLIGYAYPGAAPELHRGLPSRYLTLVITLDGPLGVAWPGGPLQTYDAVVGGLHSTAVHVGATPSRAGVQVSLTPAAARTLLGLPPGELASLNVGLDEVLGRPARVLTDQLREAGSWGERMDLIERLFLEHLARERAPGGVRPEVSWAWRRLCGTDGTIGVQKLAAEVGWSRRHLTDRFRSEFGLAPKVAARVLRFERATRQLRLRPQTRLGELSAAVGYADQAHLTREFQAIAGCSPRQWMSEELPNLQDCPPPGAAESEVWTSRM
ncbi:AraC family transcriptional regulator [Kribbella solani]|uniref:AraC family transcriptional regulator n=1 Tax=Kribbella solani TaxID=236067 RepID=UPI0029B07087|nr:AraC family transcriptional regulator [Kribbella solani]MDX2969345.1 AraC family transcriptional regulator [Kribbella solani]MDX3000276.1 AraC family transcriptional regulator [Kribbella solani]